MEKLSKIENLLKKADKLTTSEDLEKFLLLVLKTIKNSKQDFDSLSKQNIADIKSAIAYIEKHKSGVVESISKEGEKTRQELKNELAKAAKFLEEVKKIKAIPGKDGEDGLDGYTPIKGEDYMTDEEVAEIRQNIVAELKQTPDTGEQIIDKINDVPEKGPKIDAKHIKNLPQSVTTIVEQGGFNVGGFETQIKAGSNVTVTKDASGAWVIGSTSSGGSGDVSKVGTPADNQIGVWTGDGTIEGDANFTWDGSTLTIAGDLSMSGANHNMTNIGDITFQTGVTGGTVRTGTSAADKFTLQAYDVDGGAYTTLIEADAGNTVRLQVMADFLEIEDNTDATKQVTWDLSGATTSTATDLVFAQTANRSITFPDATGTVMLTSAIGSTVQAYDADLDTWAGITPGTDVGTALAVNVGTAGAFVVNGGALGTPSSGTATNLTGTASGLTAGAVTNATLTTALTVNTGAVTLTGNAAGSTLTLGAGASSLSGTAYVVSGTDVAVADGGTGKSSWTQYLIPYADTTTSFSQIAIGTSGQVLTSNGAGAAPTFQDAAGGAPDTLFINAVTQWSGLTNEGTIAADPTSGTFRLVELTDGATEDVEFHFTIPSGYTGISSIQVVYLQNAASNNIYLSRIDTNANPIDGTNITADSLTNQAITIGGTTTGTSRYNKFTIPAGSYDNLTLGTGYLVSVKYRRAGGDANDTYNANLYVAGYLITFS